MKTKHTEKRFISIFSDYGFKVTFGNEADTRFLKTALQALIQSKVPIKKISFSNVELKGITKESRDGFIDLMCEDEAGNQFIVEMQQFDFDYFLNRLKYYAFHKFNVMVQKGDYHFDNLKKIYAIVFVSEKIFPFSKEFHHIAKIYNQHHELIDDQISYIVVELGKFNKQLSEIGTYLDKLLYFMKTIHNAAPNDQLPEYFSEEWLKSAIDKLEKSKLSKEERMAYEMELAKIGSYLGALEAREKKGEKRGEKKGEKKNREFIVINLLRDGTFTIDQIAKVAGIPKEEVLNIQKKMN